MKRRSTALLRRPTPLPLLALAACALADRDAEVPRPDRQPNILLFLVDDLGWQDLSVALAAERSAFNDRYHTPNLQRLNPVRVGEDPIEQHKLDLALEVDAIERLNEAIALCREKGDNGTRELLEGILRDEEEGADWIEAQLHLVEQIGRENYLAEQIRD